ncbi:unnamed protein product [Didymodactylos carnosus]|uniref:Uncharacterized protein n=1 Tax=Didymodactylos carnosus TaxID=1234261 RepID=A0A815VT24_9BILA|nr:unnamed protein product [Didymodactylos carnosus]CAF4394145.1 unnamed protein product [Didymodactylos carnosus]
MSMLNTAVYFNYVTEIIQLQPHHKLVDIQNILINKFNVDMNLYNTQFLDNRVGEYIDLDEEYFNNASDLLLWSKDNVIELQLVLKYTEQCDSNDLNNHHNPITTDHKSDLNDSDDHLLIWLDQHIGISEYCVSLKKAFGMMVDPSSVCVTWDIKQIDIDGLIRTPKEESAQNFYRLLPCDKVEVCLELIKANANKRIILITSGSLGEQIMPHIDQCPQVDSVYVFCGNISHHIKWAIDYLDVLQIFDHETDLLVRLVRDLSKYYIQKGQVYLQNVRPTQALDCFSYAKQFIFRANSVDRRDYIDDLQTLDGSPPLYQGLIFQAEQQLENMTKFFLDTYISENGPVDIFL